jgi:glycosyltransferase involved in cell wall biosynthesis
MRTRDHLVISDVDWDDDRRLSIHHIVQGLLARGERVIYFDSTGGLRRLGLNDLGRAIAKLRGRTTISESRSTALHPGTYARPVVIQPLAVPDPEVTIQCSAINGLLLRASMRRAIRLHGILSPVIWTRVASGPVHRALLGVDRSALVYYVTGEERLSPFLTPRIRSHLEDWDVHFTQQADAVFLSARGLRERRDGARGVVEFFPNGVDLGQLRRHRPHRRAPSAPDGPIAGFMGTIDRRLDVALLESAAALLPHWRFVLVGPVTDAHIGRALAKQPNITLMGSVPFRCLPKVASRFHCGLIPYVLSDFTRCTFPCKFAEYLALGIPVVATPLEELQPHSHLMTVVRDGIEAAAVIARWANPASDAAAEALRKQAEQFSWDSMINRMRHIIEQCCEAHARST